MAASNGPRPIDPSQYVAQHLQQFAGSSTTTFASGDYAGAFVWSANGIIVSSVLLVIVAGYAALTDRWSLFSMDPIMSFGRRLYVWWSCAWRQWLASTLFFAFGVFAFNFLSTRAILPVMGFVTNLVAASAGRTSPQWSFPLVEMPVILMILLYLLLSLPLAGYVVRGGLSAHDIPGPERLGLWHATLLGATTYAWSLPGALLITELAIWLPHPVSQVLRGIGLVAWGMYIVLPRQLRRMTRFSRAGRSAVAH
jgi:hypothetical protein